MKFNLMALTAGAAILLACTSDIFLMKRDETLNRYAMAVRWGEFEKAREFQLPAFRKPLDEAWLKNIHISTYDTVFTREDATGKSVEQTVEIHYFNEQAGVEKSLTDRQVWRFDEDAERWVLMTDLPTFR